MLSLSSSLRRLPAATIDFAFLFFFFFSHDAASATAAIADVISIDIAEAFSLCRFSLFAAFISLLPSRYASLLLCR